MLAAECNFPIARSGLNRIKMHPDSWSTFYSGGFFIGGIAMMKKILFVATLLLPFAVFAEPNEKVLEHAKEQTHSLHAHFNAPEIDGSNLMLGIALVGGVLGLLRKSR
jgi:hypothetical protein